MRSRDKHTAFRLATSIWHSHTVSDLFEGGTDFKCQMPQPVDLQVPLEDCVPTAADIGVRAPRRLSHRLRGFRIPPRESMDFREIRFGNRFPGGRLSFR